MMMMMSTDHNLFSSVSVWQITLFSSPLSLPSFSHNFDPCFLVIAAPSQAVLGHQAASFPSQHALSLTYQDPSINQIMMGGGRGALIADGVKTFKAPAHKQGVW